MRTRISILSILLALALLAAGASASLVIMVPDDDVLVESMPDGGSVVTWDWGCAVIPAGSADLLPLDQDSFGIDTSPGLATHGPQDSDGRAPLSFTTGGTVLVVDGDVAIETVAEHTVISAPAGAMDPRAGIIMFLGLLVLTGVMMRHTRRSIASR